MHGAFEGEQHADGPRPDLPRDVHALRPGRVDARPGVAPEVGGVVHLEQQDRQRTPRDLRRGAQVLEVTVAEIRIHLDHAGVRAPHRGSESGELRIARRQSGRVATVLRAVLLRARGREAQGPGPQCGFEQFAHPVDLGGVRPGGMIGAALAHHVEPQRCVRDLRADVDHALRRVEHVEVLLEAFPPEIDAFGEHGLGNVLDAFHQVDQIALGTRPHRGEADAAVPEHRRRDAMQRRRGHVRIPRRLAVVVRVDVDPARREQQSGGIDLAPAGSDAVTDGGDDGAVHGEVGDAPRRPGAIHQRRAPDHEIVHVLSPSSCRERPMVAAAVRPRTVAFALRRTKRAALRYHRASRRAPRPHRPDTEFRSDRCAVDPLARTPGASQSDRLRRPRRATPRRALHRLSGALRLVDPRARRFLDGPLGLLRRRRRDARRTRADRR